MIDIVEDKLINELKPNKLGDVMYEKNGLIVVDDYAFGQIVFGSASILCMLLCYIIRGVAEMVAIGLYSAGLVFIGCSIICFILHYVCIFANRRRINKLMNS